MQIFGQVWLWSLGSFLLGALFTWLLLVRPVRRRLAEMETAAPAYMPVPAPLPPMQLRPEPIPPGRPEPVPTRVVEPVLAPPEMPGPNATDRSLDDLFDSQRKPPLPPLVPPAPAEPANIQNRLNPGPTAPPEPPLEQHSQTLMVPSVGAIQSPSEDSDTELADNSWQAFTESTTVFVPPSNLPSVPPSVDPNGQDWFVKEAEAEADPHAITDVEDDERVDNTGTIFTQHTTPIPAEVIRTLDDSQPEVPAETPAEMTQAIMPSTPAKHGLPEEPAPAFTSALEPDDPNHAFTSALEPEPTHAFTTPVEPEPNHAFESEPTQVFTPPPSEPYTPPVDESFAPPVPGPAESGRSLFEPVIPVADQHAAVEQDEFVPPGPFGPGSAMPLPGGGSPAPEFNVKASVTALRYCTKDNPQFDRIVAEVWFRTPSDAERVGFRVLS